MLNIRHYAIKIDVIGYISFYTGLKNQTQPEKTRFIKVNELKLTQVELFYFFQFIRIDTNASEFFDMAHLANIESFLYHPHLSF